MYRRAGVRSRRRNERLRCEEGEIASSYTVPRLRILNLEQIIFKNSVPTAQKTRSVSVTNTSGAFLFNSIILVYSENRMKHIQWDNLIPGMFAACRFRQTHVPNHISVCSNLRL
jgi:hypothetical protein